jgi:YegS/Rv2252/BmrU family lipid kinase
LNRVCIIINPAARGAKARLRRLERIARDAVIKTTLGPGDAEAQAERAVEQGYGTIVAAGGDGTINEVVNGIGTAPVALGILPMGTVNVFAMELGIPFNLESAWRVVRAHRVRLIDLASANGHYFVQMAGVGLDAQIVQRNKRDIKAVFGPLSYLLTATRVAAEKPPRLRVTSSGHPAVEGSFVLVGNGRFYGGPFALFNEADPQDGLLDVPCAAASCACWCRSDLNFSPRSRCRAFSFADVLFYPCWISSGPGSPSKPWWRHVFRKFYDARNPERSITSSSKRQCSRRDR